MMPWAPWGFQMYGQCSDAHSVALPALWPLAPAAPAALQPALAADSLFQPAMGVDAQGHHHKRVMNASKRKEKKHKQKSNVSEPKSLSHIEEALLNVGDDVKAKFQGATVHQLRPESAAYAAVSVPATLTDSLGRRASDFQSSVSSFLKIDVESGGGYATLLWPGLLMAAYPELRCSLDLLLVAVLMQCLRNRGDTTNLLNQFVEFSAGSGMLTLQCLMIGLRGCGLDKCFGSSQDNRTPSGLRLWLQELALTEEGALTWWGTECSSFSAMCKSGSQRFQCNLFLGIVKTNDDSDFVHRGNVQMTITALLIFLSSLLSNACVLEQPLGSVMPLAPPLSTVLQFIGASRETTWHSSFGADTAKPFQLIGNRRNIIDLKRPKPKRQAGTSLCVTGDSGSYTGIKNVLKGSQAYTAEFAKSVCTAFFGHR